MNLNIGGAFDSISRTANQVGHQLGQYVDGQAVGGLLGVFSTGNILCLVPRWTGRALQIVAAADGRLVVDGLGVEGSNSFNTHWTVVNEGNNVVRLHNNNNYLCITSAQLTVIHCPAGSPLGVESKLRVSQSSNCWVTLESVKEPSNYIAIDLTGQSVAGVYNLAPSSQTQTSRQMTPKLLMLDDTVVYQRSITLIAEGHQKHLAGLINQSISPQVCSPVFHALSVSMEADKLLWIFLLLTCHSCWGLINKAQEMEIRHEIRVLLAEGAGDGHPLMAGCARLLFHDAVGGGTNGCINLDIDDNRGLENYISQLEKIDRSRWGISKADLWVLCAFESIHLGAILTPPDKVTRVKAMPHNLIFQQGRKDHPEPCPLNELPGPNIDPVPFIMEKFPGFTIEDSVALMGAHTLGKAHLVASGYNNKWVEFPDWCDNEYYKDMIDRSKKWKQVPRFSPIDGSLLHQWVLADTDSRLMLHCDMAMWMEVLVPENTSSSMCGYPGTSPYDCGRGPYVDLVEKFAANNSLWLDAFCDAVMKLVALGHENLQPVLP